MMYYKLIVINGDVNELCNHLDMNGYSFENIGQNFYIFEDEITEVKTICDDRNIEYIVEGE